MTDNQGTPSPSARENIRNIPFDLFERIALAKLCQEKMNEAIAKGSYETEQDWRTLKDKIIG